MSQSPKTTIKSTPVASGNTFRTPTYGFDEFTTPIPINQMAQSSMDPRVAQMLIEGELDLDYANSADLGSYVTDHMDVEAQALILRTLGKVFIDKAEYPRTAKMALRIGWMLQNWYNGIGQDPDVDGSKVVGAVTIGSSEAIHLGMLAHRRNWEIAWRQRLSSASNPERYRRDKPLFLFARNAHTCFKKFENYFGAVGIEVDFLKVPGTFAIDHYTLHPPFVASVLNSTIWGLQTLDHNNDPAHPTPYLDAFNRICESCGFNPVNAADQALLQSKTVKELTFAVAPIVGSTFTAEKDDVAAINTVLETIASEAYPDTAQSLFIPMHVDAASGGFVLPFTDPDNTDWKFQKTANDPNGSSHVRSINVSLHKFGLVYPGLGCVLFANEDVVDDSLIYHITYLGHSFYDFNVNFSRGSAMIIAGYYNLIRNGLDGYSEIIKNCYENAQYLATQLQNASSVGTNRFQIISDNTRFPWVVFKDTLADTTGTWTLADLADELEKSNWQLPHYQLPDNSSKEPDGPNAMRIVVRQNISRNKIDLLLADIKAAVATLEHSAIDYANPAVRAALAHKRERHTQRGPLSGT